MKRLILFVILFAQTSFSFTNSRWAEYSRHESLNIKQLIEILSRSSTGKELLKLTKKKAALTGRKLLDVIKPGDGSYTDTTLVRRFTAENPEEVEYVSKSVVYIDKELGTYDAILDLAHELTHFVYREDFNPYVLNFSLKEFIHSTVEGVGGEVDAFLMECKIMGELFNKKSQERYSCSEVFDKSVARYSRDLAINKFYRVGEFFSEFSGKLNKKGIRGHFEKLSKEEAIFISSAYGLPYPVAAYEEYESILSRVCENDRKRLGYFNSRSPASQQNHSQMLALKKSFHQRCK